MEDDDKEYAVKTNLLADMLNILFKLLEGCATRRVGKTRNM